jgi:aminopeptidase N/puromycin-sensitive aminopeptidase
VPAGNLFFANAGGKGYYRSAYPPGVYTNLVAQVESSLAPTERISLIGDEWAQVRANKSSVGTYLNLVTAVKDDPNADVISSAIDGVNAIYERVASTRKERAALSSWIRTTFEPEYAKLGTPSEHDSPNTRELRAVLFADLGLNGEDPSILAQARDISKRYLEDPSSIDSTLGETALAVAAKNGDAALFDRLQNVYETSTNPERQIGALRLLARFESPALIERALNFAVSGKVRNQDAAAQLAIALDSDNSRNQAWKFIQANWNKVQTELTPELGAYLVESAGNFCSQPERDSVESFFSTHNVPAAEQTLKHAIESINGCIELRALQEPKLHSWLATQTTGL